MVIAERQGRIATALSLPDAVQVASLDATCRKEEGDGLQ